jgi:hypothetical protein
MGAERTRAIHRAKTSGTPSVHLSSGTQTALVFQNFHFGQRPGCRTAKDDFGYSSPAPIVDEFPLSQVLKAFGRRRQTKTSSNFSARKREKIASTLDFHKPGRLNYAGVTVQIIESSR